METSRVIQLLHLVSMLDMLEIVCLDYLCNKMKTIFWRIESFFAFNFGITG